MTAHDALKITKQNLEELSAEHSRLSSSRYGVLSDLAFVVAKEIAEALPLEDKTLSLKDNRHLAAPIMPLPLAEAIAKTLPIYQEAVQASVNTNAFLRLSDNIGNTLLYTNALSLALKQLFGRKLTIADFLPIAPLPPRATVALTQNAFSEASFSSFAKPFGLNERSFARSMEDAITQVDSGMASFAILPFWDAKKEIIPKSASLLKEHDLKIVGVTDVPTSDFEETRYALLAPVFVLPSRYASLPTKEQGDGCFSFSLYGEEDISLSALELPLNAFGFSVVRSLFTLTEYERLHLSMTVTGHGDFTSLFIFLSLFFKSFVPDGLYRLYP